MKLLLPLATLAALSSSAEAGFGPDPDSHFLPVMCLVSPEPGTTIAIEAGEPEETTTSGGKILLIEGFADTATALRNAGKLAEVAATAGIETTGSVTALVARDKTASLAVPVIDAHGATPDPSSGAKLVDFPPSKIARIQHWAPTSEFKATIMKLIEFVKASGLKPGKFQVIEYQDPDDVTNPTKPTINYCLQLE